MQGTIPPEGAGPEGGGGREQDALDARRRRLYAPGATDADLAAYRDAAPGPAPMPGPRSAPEMAPRSGAGARQAAPRLRLRLRLRRGVVLGAAGTLLVVVAAVVVVVQQGPAGGFSPAPSTTRATLRAAAPAPTTVADRVPVAAAVRTAFVRALDAGRAPGVLDYFFEHPRALPPSLRTTVRAASTEYSGRGTRTIALDPSQLAALGGRMTVVVVLDRDADFSWRAERIAQDDDRSGPVVPVGSYSGSGRAGEPTSVTIVTDGAASRLAVFVDESVRWGAVVVFTD